MKIYRCPWCGEKGILPAPPRRRSGLIDPDCDFGCGRCKNCGQQYYDMSGSDSKLYQIFWMIFFVVSLVLLVLVLIQKQENQTLNLLFVLSVLLLFVGQFIVHFNRPIYIRHTEKGQMPAPFEYSFKAKLRFLSLKEGGVVRRKKRFYNGAILAAKFEYKEKEVNKYIYKTPVAMVFDDIKYKNNMAVCKAAFILDEKIDKDFLKEGLKFDLYTNEEKCFAKGKVTYVLERKEPLFPKPKRKKRKNWQDPEYFQ